MGRRILHGIAELHFFLAFLVLALCLRRCATVSVNGRRRGAWWGAPRHENHGVSAHALHQCPGRHWDHSEAPNGHVWRWGGLEGAMGGTRRKHVGVLTTCTPP